MSWLSSSWRFRAPVSVDLSAWSSGPSDVSISLPSTWDLFWENVNTDGSDVRLCDSDGTTLLTYQIASSPTWSKSGRTGTLEVDDLAAPTAACQRVIWLYWGYSGASSAAGSFTASSAVTGCVHLLGAAEPVIRLAPQRPGSARPLQAIHFDTGDVRRVHLDFGALLGDACRPYAGRRWREELAEIVATVRDDDDVDLVSPACDDADTRIVGCHQGRGAIVAVRVDGSALAHGSDYTLRVVARTSESLTRIGRVALYCRNVRPG